jgi:hypothetical protein
MLPAFTTVSGALIVIENDGFAGWGWASAGAKIIVMRANVCTARLRLVVMSFLLLLDTGWGLALNDYTLPNRGVPPAVKGAVVCVCGTLHSETHWGLLKVFAASQA